ncbi:lysophosphatidic acid receptor 6-like [Erpetoichthys calabaricus]|uniref:Lysophosphatidic acid receptor 6-like n=1 Tax=Erpetoichthys calabaricus TaxID=27687 RepID=A0A8C4TFA8_ERPCA|nr:lysophosphatidic acid receptor 6-like [Erpetoichthys calabaricus]
MDLMNNILDGPVFNYTTVTTPLIVTQCQPQKLNVVLPSLLAIFFIVGFILNCLSLWIFWFQIKKWNSGMVLQFNLAVADAIITPAAPFIVLYSLSDDWVYGQFLCQMKVYLLSVHMYGSISFLTVISIHRYMTVVHGTKNPRFADVDFVKKLCLFVWVFLILQGLPFFGILKTSYINNSTKCLSIHQNGMAELYFVYNVTVLIVGLMVPFCVCFICYSLLSSFISKINTCNVKGEVMKAKSTQMIAVSLFIFTICYIPIHITRTMGVTVKLFFPSHCTLLEKTEIAYYITYTLSGANCCLDPILYCFASKKFKTSFNSYFSNLKVSCPGCDSMLRKKDELPTPSFNMTDSSQVI